MKNTIDELRDLASEINSQAEGTDGGYPDGIRTAVAMIQDRIAKLQQKDSIGLFELIHTLMEMYEKHNVIEVGFGGSQTYDNITRIEFVDGCRIKLIGEE